MVSLEHLEEQHIQRVIENCANLSDAASILGIDQATLYRKRKKMVRKDRPATPAEITRMPVAAPCAARA
jgi:DNA-binding NtrC family response regulator